jgi:DNA-directed RNA polymerase I, II, and III subunit RPABC2
MSDNEYEPSINDSDSEKDDNESVVSEDEPKKKIKIHNDSDEDEDISGDELEEASDMDPEEILSEDELEANLKSTTISHFPEIESDDDDDEEDDENYLKKFDEDLQKNIIENFHPELKAHNYEEIDALATIVKDSEGNIIDPFHKTTPILSRYERARILGERAKQINEGAQPFIEVESHIIDGYLIAEKELEQKKIPFIIQRPLPSGGSEYWRIRDLEIL